MITTIEEAMNWIHSREKFGMKPGLERMEWMLEELGNPERRLKTIHIAGTNGKGSVVSFLRHMFQQSNLVVGTFTSPYIESFHERISVNGEPISDDDLLKAVNDVKPLVEQLDNNAELGAPTEFEVVTVMAIQYFARTAYPDLVLFETGLGGRLDSTNIIHPLVSIITNIGHDHLNILGDTIEEIAREKAGIIKSGVPVITGVTQPEALEVIEDEMKGKRTKIYRANKEFMTLNEQRTETGETFSFQSPFMNVDNLEITMKGLHQVKNASLALMTVDYLKRFYSLIVDEEEMREGLKKASWPARFEVVQQNPTVIIDGAHNPEGMQTLQQTVERYYPGKNVHVIFAALHDKKLDEMLNVLDDFAESLSFVDFDFPRAAKAEDLYEISKAEKKAVYESWQEAYETVKGYAGEGDVILFAGSLYFVAGVRAELI
ncbi:folylpolyglutamate synthase/dihydrofolate synthase family protein [Bacillus tianshenii]|nr:folylpolyglutamate synthase/dihydrofolate synthase family protein [Bacillus tianshenii]